MHWSKRGPGSPSRRRRASFQPDSESLEGRRLLTTFDLTQTQTAPYGVEMVGKASNNIAGYTVTDVGDVTGSGYDSFTIAATGDSDTTAGSKPLNPTFSNGSAVYLVFGSKEVNINTIQSYLTLPNGVAGTTTSGALVSGQRAGDLGELGTLGVGAQTDIANPTKQTNPTVYQPQPVSTATHVYGFDFDGLTFVTGLNATTGLGTTDGLGYSVTPLGDFNDSGFDSFAISAPNDTGGGRVFVIEGGSQLQTQTVANKTIDLEPTPGTITTTAPTKVVSFYDSVATSTSEVGYSIAGIGNYFGTSSYTGDLAIGAPGMNGDVGEVFTVSGNYINTQATGANIDLNTLYSGNQTTSANGLAGIAYTGVVADGELGYSVATAGNFDGVAGTNGSPLDDLLIGAPGNESPTNPTGNVYLIYANQPYLNNKLIGTTVPLTTLGMPLLTAQNNPTNALQGVIFTDRTADGFGSSVATAGDFNDDGFDDIMIGAPYYQTTAGLANTGFVYVVYGQQGTATNQATTKVNGTFAISPTAATSGITSNSYIGTGANAYTGFSIASVGHIQFGTTTTAAPAYDILIGAPGIGTAYLVPGMAGGTTPATFMLSLSDINTTLGGNAFTASGTSDVAIIAGGFATSVSARNLVVDPEKSTSYNTVDTDQVQDLFFGAPYSNLYDPNNLSSVERSLAGVTYIVEGNLIGGTSSTSTTTTTTTTTATSTTPLSNIVTTTQPVVFTGVDDGLASPPVSQLSHLISYAPLPVQLAEQQFRVKPGFLARENVSQHPGKTKGNVHQAPAGTVLNVAAIGGSESKYAKDETLPPKVFARGKTTVGKKTTFTHKVKVIPTNLQTETYSG